MDLYWQNQMHIKVGGSSRNCLETSTAIPVVERHIARAHTRMQSHAIVTLISHVATSGHRPCGGKGWANQRKISFGCPCLVATDWHCTLYFFAVFIGKPKVCRIFSWKVERDISCWIWANFACFRHCLFSVWQTCNLKPGQGQRRVARWSQGWKPQSMAGKPEGDMEDG